MRLGVVTSGPFNNLPDELLTHRVNHSPDIFYKKSRPYVKITVPPGYTENQALCQQFIELYRAFHLTRYFAWNLLYGDNKS